jgi:hypothetical protein
MFQELWEIILQNPLNGTTLIFSLEFGNNSASPEFIFISASQLRLGEWGLGLGLRELGSQNCRRVGGKKQWIKGQELTPCMFVLILLLLSGGHLGALLRPIVGIHSAHPRSGAGESKEKGYEDQCSPEGVRLYLFIFWQSFWDKQSNVISFPKCMAL